MKNNEEIFKECAEKGQLYYNHLGFKKDFKILFGVIMEAMKEAQTEISKNKIKEMESAEEMYNAFSHTVSGYISKGNAIALAKAYAQKAIEKDRKNVAQHAKLYRISDSEPGAIFNLKNSGTLCISGFWAGQYITINKDSIINAPQIELK